LPVSDSVFAEQMPVHSVDMAEHWVHSDGGGSQRKRLGSAGKIHYAGAGEGIGPNWGGTAARSWIDR
jgi:hypothetical protein